MTSLLIITISLYLLSSAGYICYLIRQDIRCHKAGIYLFTAGFASHLILFAYDYLVTGHIPTQNLRGTLIFAAMAFAAVFLVLQFRFSLKILGTYVAPLNSLILVIASMLRETPYTADNIFNNFWLVFHIVTVFMGDAAFALACGIGIFYLLQEKAIKNKTQGFFFSRLPSLELIDNMGYVCVITGFTMLSTGLITGLIYANLIWGRFWSWDPKEVWSAITWLLYAILLHGRISLGWRGRKAAIMCILGFCVLLFTFLGVNFLLKGHHGEFTRF
jgi:cytochrome c-type biogenesis protein CcsB